MFTQSHIKAFRLQNQQIEIGVHDFIAYMCMCVCVRVNLLIFQLHTATDTVSVAN